MSTPVFITPPPGVVPAPARPAVVHRNFSSQAGRSGQYRQDVEAVAARTELQK